MVQPTVPGFPPKTVRRRGPKEKESCFALGRLVPPQGLGISLAPRHTPYPHKGRDHPPSVCGFDTGAYKLSPITSASCGGASYRELCDLTGTSLSKRDLYYFDHSRIDRPRHPPFVDCSDFEFALSLHIVRELAGVPTESSRPLGFVWVGARATQDFYCELFFLSYCRFYLAPPGHTVYWRSVLLVRRRPQVELFGNSGSRSSQ